MTRQLRNKDTAKAGSLKSGEPVFLLVGRLLRTHGLHGEMVLDLQTDFPERMKRGKVVYYGEEHAELIVSKTRPHDRYLLVNFKDVDTIDDARKYVNQPLFVRTDEIESLPEGQFYFHEIIGMEVFENEMKIGSVSDMLETGANDVMVVQSTDEKEILLPVIENVILSIDPTNRRINVKLPEWL